MTYRPSIEQRIAWTPGLSPGEVKVLQALARFADFTTGENARPRWTKLMAWSELSRPTIARTLKRLKKGRWIEVTARHHRQPTTYRICFERLATSPTRAKTVARTPPLDTSVESQSDTQESDGLGLNVIPTESQSDTQGAGGLGLNLILHPVSGTPSQYPGTPPQQIPLTMEIPNPGPRTPDPGTSTHSTDVWTDVLAHIEPKVDRRAFYTWWQDSVLLEDQGAVLVVRAKNGEHDHELAADWIQKFFADVLADTLAEIRPGARVEWAWGVRQQPTQQQRRQAG